MKSVTQRIVDLLKNKNVIFNYFEHEPSGPSNLSKEIRSKYGFPNAVGAKALVLVVTFRDGQKRNVLSVIPGSNQLDKKKLKIIFPNMKEFRFATKEELLVLTSLVPGSVPPFGLPILPVDVFILDKAFSGIEEIGFNVGRLDASVVMKTSEYLKTVHPDFFEEVS